MKLVFSRWVLYWHATNNKQDHLTSSPLATWLCSLTTLCPHLLCSHHSCRPAHFPTIPHSGHPSPILVHLPAASQSQTQTNTNTNSFCSCSCSFAFVLIAFASPSPLTTPSTCGLHTHSHCPPVHALCIHSCHPTHLCPPVCAIPPRHGTIHTCAVPCIIPPVRTVPTCLCRPHPFVPSPPIHLLCVTSPPSSHPHMQT